MSISKNIVRVGVIGGLLVGSAVLVAGPSRVSAIAGQARGFVNEKIDGAIQDPVALRQQIRSLESQYPERIAEVRGELAELDEQLSALEKDREVAERVIDLASSDHEALKGLIELAQETRDEKPGALIRVRFENEKLPLEEAYTKAAELSSTVSAYRSRLNSAEDSLALLSTQRERLSGLLTELEEERSRFRAQIWQLDSEIEMIARNDKMLEIFEQREKSIDRLDKTEAASLDHVMARMARIRAEQEAKFESLADGPRETYEEAAERMIESERAAKQLYEKTREMNESKQTARETVDVTGDDLESDGHENGSDDRSTRLVIGE